MANWLDAHLQAPRLSPSRPQLGSGRCSLPAEVFDMDAVLSCRVDAKARVPVRESYYSVPARHAGRRLEVRLDATSIRVLDPSAHGKVIAEHARSLHKGTEGLVLDHYLEVLVRKPGALVGSTALACAKASGLFTADHQRFWTAARAALGDGTGTRALIGVLLLHRTTSASAVAAGMAAAFADGVFDPDLVAVHARRATTTRTTTIPIALPETAAPAAAEQRPAPSLAGYDQLLTTSGRQLEEAIA